MLNITQDWHHRPGRIHTSTAADGVGFIKIFCGREEEKIPESKKQ